jgi:hypothetical protein
VVTIITANGHPVMLSEAQDARIIDGLLVCLDAGSDRILSFDPLDVLAYAVDDGRDEPVWIMANPELAQPESAPPEAKKRLPWRLPSVLRPITQE